MTERPSRSARPFPDLPANPFDEAIVAEPRKIETAVAGLNDAPLVELINRFSQLERGPIPREPDVSLRASLVASPDRGFGKSHLLGRLFRSLRGRASLVYLRPFEDPIQPWFSILLQTVQELGRADRFDGAAPRQFSQIEVMSYGVLTHLAADYLETTQGNEYREMIRVLRRNPLEAYQAVANDPHWRDWLHMLCVEYSARFVDRLEHRGIDLHGREEAWIKILFALSLGSAERDRRRAALRWLRGECLEEGEAALLSLREADNNVHPSAGPHQINQYCRERLLALCKLAAFYRPFVFCFDQTESFETDRQLIVTFGTIIESLYAEFPHQMTVLTANEFSWTEALLPNLLPACRSRIQAPLVLEGIDRAQAKELVKNRLEIWELNEETIERFADSAWLESVFQHRDKIPARDLLVAAAIRWRDQGAVETAMPRAELEVLFQTYLNDVRANPQMLQFNRDALLWFVRSLAHHAEGLVVSSSPTTPHFPVRWAVADGRIVFFGFESGGHHLRWKNIAEDAIELQKNAGKPVRILMLRTPDLEQVPRPGWLSVKDEIDRAMRNGLSVLALSYDEYVEVLAARELYADAQQTNIEWAPTEVREWLRQRLQHWWPRLIGSDTAEEGPRNDLLSQVEEILRKERFISVHAVSDKLKGLASVEQICEAMRDHPNVRTIPTPTSIVLQWIQR